MDDFKGLDQFKDIGFLILGALMTVSLGTATDEYGLAGFLLILFMFFAPAVVLDMFIKSAKERRKRKVRPTVSDLSRAGDEAERRMNKTREEYLKKVQTMTRR